MSQDDDASASSDSDASSSTAVADQSSQSGDSDQSSSSASSSDGDQSSTSDGQPAAQADATAAAYCTATCDTCASNGVTAGCQLATSHDGNHQCASGHAWTDASSSQPGVGTCILGCPVCAASGYSNPCKWSAGHADAHACSNNHSWQADPASGITKICIDNVCGWVPPGYSLTGTVPEDELRAALIHAGAHGLIEVAAHTVSVYEATQTARTLLQASELLKLGGAFGRGFVAGAVVYVVDKVLFSTVAYCPSYCPDCNRRDDGTRLTPHTFHCDKPTGHSNDQRPEHLCGNQHSWIGDPIGVSPVELWDP